MCNEWQVANPFLLVIWGKFLAVVEEFSTGGIGIRSTISPLGVFPIFKRNHVLCAGRVYRIAYSRCLPVQRSIIYLHCPTIDGVCKAEEHMRPSDDSTIPLYARLPNRFFECNAASIPLQL